jgi:hypothetical protein
LGSSRFFPLRKYQEREIKEIKSLQISSPTICSIIIIITFFHYNAKYDDVNYEREEMKEKKKKKAK